MYCTKLVIIMIRARNGALHAGPCGPFPKIFACGRGYISLQSHVVNTQYSKLTPPPPPPLKLKFLEKPLYLKGSGRTNAVTRAGDRIFWLQKPVMKVAARVKEAVVLGGCN